HDAGDAASPPPRGPLCAWRRCERLFEPVGLHAGSFVATPLPTPEGTTMPRSEAKRTPPPSREFMLCCNRRRVRSVAGGRRTVGWEWRARGACHRAGRRPDPLALPTLLSVLSIRAQSSLVSPI